MAKKKGSGKSAGYHPKQSTTYTSEISRAPRPGAYSAAVKKTKKMTVKKKK